MRLAVLAIGVVALLVVAVARAAPATAAASGYQPPVSAPVADSFRPPSSQYGPGNRGLDYATGPGVELAAAADGEVVFAGQVGGTLHVVLLHGDGIRTSYSFLSSIRVRRGDKVRQGQVVGTTGNQPFHFGARAGDAYIDPALLFSTGPPDVHLVPDSEQRRLSEAGERSGLLGMLAGAVGRATAATGDAVAWAAGAAVGAAGRSVSAVHGQYTLTLDDLRARWEACLQQFPGVQAFNFVTAVAGIFEQSDCTPPDVKPPQVRDHIAVLVGGLGSSGDPKHPTEGARIFAVNTRALGYDDKSVFRFSYRGGTIEQHPYGKRDTEVDIRASGVRLRDLLEQIQHDHPGATVDVLAHSQGGLVTRAALAPGYDPLDNRLPRLGAIVTMASPHHGTDGATAAAMIRRNPVADVELRGVHVVAPDQDDPRATSIAQMSEDSSFIAWLNNRDLPGDVWFTSIGGREDWLVPATQTHLAGAHNVTLSVPSRLTHDALPVSAAALRETELALNHLPPTCQGLLTRAANTVVPYGVHEAEQSVGRTLSAGGIP